MQLNVKVGIDFQKSELMTNACDTAHCSQVQYLMPSPSEPYNPRSRQFGNKFYLFRSNARAGNLILADDAYKQFIT